MNTQQALYNFNRLDDYRQRLDKTRSYYENLAWNDPDRRKHAEKMREACTEAMFETTKRMDELEPQLATSLHNAAEIVNGYALVIGWREW